MLDVLTKAEVWQWYDEGHQTDAINELKGAQDAYILGSLGDIQGARILEIGGGRSRVLARLNEHNECWNAEPYEGAGGGPKTSGTLKHVKQVPVYMGDFSPELEDGYFDVVFSVSVVEHVANDRLEAFFQDCARVLKPGGRMLHAIDIYLFDRAELAPRDTWRKRVALYRAAGSSPRIDLEFSAPPQIDEDLHFKCEYTSNPDHMMYRWNRTAPALKEIRSHAQVCSIKMEMIKSGQPPVDSQQERQPTDLPATIRNAIRKFLPWRRLQRL